MEWWQASESTLRLSVFGGVFLVCALAEWRWPRRQVASARPLRWSANIAVSFIGSLLVRLAVPLLAVQAAVIASDQGWGLLNFFSLPLGLGVLLSVLLLDLLIYWQHRLFHAVPLLWRLHRMHHSDTHIDVSTGIRFHPVEIALSMQLKVAAVLVLGAPALGVLVFEVLLNASALFNHSNLRLSPALDAVLRQWLVTPDMHRVHHSWQRAETDSNFGFCLPWWDRLFGSYRAQPDEGHQAMTIGLRAFRADQDQRLDQLLLQPLRRVSPQVSD